MSVHSHSDGSEFDRPPQYLAEAARPVIPGYELIDVIGQGAMGVVYLARQQRLNRDVALKVIQYGGHADPQKQARFKAEAEAIASLQHPRIVQIHDSGDWGDAKRTLPYLVMEYCPGGDLAAILKNALLSPQQAAELVEGLAEATHAAHAKNIVHRDLKPANVLIAADNKAKISDFGLVRWLDDPRESTAVIVGTPSYMPPEQAKGEEVGPAADVYALGAILYECLTGRPPFKGANRDHTLKLVREEEPVSVRAIQPGVPRDLDAICLKCLEKESSRRYATALELAKDLQRFLDGRPTLARPPSWWGRAVKWVRRNPAQAALLLVILSTAIGFVSLILDNNTHLRIERDNTTRALEAETRALAQEAHQKLLAREQAKLAYRRNYRADMRLVQQYVHDNQIGEALRILTFHLPAPEREDRRGLEYYRAWHLCHGDLATWKAHEGGVNVLAVSPSAGLLASGGNDGAVRLWNISDRTEVGGHTKHEGFVTTLVFSPDGKTLVSGGADGRVLHWDVAARRVVESRKEHRARIVEVAFAPDGRALASVGLDGTLQLRRDGVVKWSIQHGKPFNKCSSLCFAPNGTELVTAGEILGGGRTTFEIVVWDAANGAILQQKRFSDALIDRVRYSPDGKFMATGSRDGVIDVWKTDERNVAAKSMPITAHRDNVISALAFSSDGRLLLTGSWDQTIQLFDLQTKRFLDLFRGHTNWVRDVALLPDGKRFASADADGMIKFWSVHRPPEAIGLRAPKADGAAFEPLSLTLSPSGGLLAASSKVGTVRLFNLADGSALSTKQCHPIAAPAIAFFPDGRRLVTGAMDKKVKVWRVPEWELLATLDGHTNDVRMATVSPHGRFLGTGSDDQTVKIWDMATGQVRATFPIPHSEELFIQCGAFSHDEKRFAAALSGPPGLIKIWDLEERRELTSFAGHAKSGVYQLTFSPDDSLLATAGGDQTAKVWNARNGRAIRTLKGHTSAVSAVAITPDGLRLVTASFDGTVKLWDDEGEEIALLSKGPPVWGLQFVPSENTLVVGLDQARVAFLRVATRQSMQLKGMR